MRGRGAAPSHAGEWAELEIDTRASSSGGLAARKSSRGGETAAEAASSDSGDGAKGGGGAAGERADGGSGRGQQAGGADGGSGSGDGGSSGGSNGIRGSSDLARVYLVHLRSYEGMGQARVECMAGCSCEAGQMDNTWDIRTSIFEAHRFEVGRRRARRRRRWERMGRALGGSREVVCAGSPACLPAFLPH